MSKRIMTTLAQLQTEIDALNKAIGECEKETNTSLWLHIAALGQVQREGIKREIRAVLMSERARTIRLYNTVLKED